MKKISLYLVTRKDSLKNDTKDILTFVTTKKEAKEYIIKRCIADNFEHYKSWCELREFDTNNIHSQFLYFTDVIDKDTVPYVFLKYNYPMSSVALAYRISTDCKPCGCSFEHPVELILYKNNKIRDLILEEALKVQDALLQNKKQNNTDSKNEKHYDA